MRLRNIPGSREVIAESVYVIHEDVMRDQKGLWNSRVFPRSAPLFLEIGMGKGRFISDLALLHPEYNYIGIEKFSSVLLRALQKRESLEQRSPLNNLFYIRMEAEDLTDVFAPGEVSGIYLNFSDPWPKDRHAKRRLTSRQFLDRYRQILKPGAILEFKTDNDDLFAFSLEEAEQSSCQIVSSIWDLHADPVLSQGNVMTEYEQRFAQMGHPIHKMTLQF